MSNESGMIPIIDLNQPDAGERMLKACRECGFFYVDNRKGQEIDTTVTQKLLEKSKQFHHLPQEVKNKYAIEKTLYNRGYISQASWYYNRTKPMHEGEAPKFEKDISKPTGSESVVFCSSNWLNDVEVTGVTDGNLYPIELGEDFPALIKSYSDYCLTLHFRIFQHLEPYLNLNKVKARDYVINNWQDAFRNLSWAFRLVRYPPLTGEISPHSDKGALTILLQDQVGGLEIWFREKWIEVPPIQNTFVVNIGDMLQELSTEVFKSTKHRVINKGNGERYSIPFFAQLGKSVEVFVDKEKKWYSQYEHACSVWYTSIKYLFEKVQGPHVLKGMTHQEIDRFHRELVLAEQQQNMNVIKQNNTQQKK